MATELKLRKGTTAQHATFTGAVAEVTIDTDKDTLVVHDGTTAGGFPLAKEADIVSSLKTADIGVTVQGYDAQLADVANLSPTDNGVIIGNGVNFVVESNSILRTSLGLAIGTDVQAYDADAAKTDVVQSFTAAQRGAITTLTDGASVETDLALANNFSLTLAGNRTLANPTNIVAGQSGVIVITQDATGSRTLAYGSNWKFANGTAPSLTTTANAVDVLAYYVDSATRITARLIGDVK